VRLAIRFLQSGLEAFAVADGFAAVVADFVVVELTGLGAAGGSAAQLTITVNNAASPQSLAMHARCAMA